MINLPRQAILEYQLVYKQQFGIEIAYEDASRQASELIELFMNIYKPVHKDWINKKKKVKVKPHQ